MDNSKIAAGNDRANEICVKINELGQQDRWEDI